MGRIIEYDANMSPLTFNQSLLQCFPNFCFSAFYATFKFFFLANAAQKYIYSVLLYQIECDLGVHSTQLWEALP